MHRMTNAGSQWWHHPGNLESKTGPVLPGWHPAPVVLWCSPDATDFAVRGTRRSGGRVQYISVTKNCTVPSAGRLVLSKHTVDVRGSTSVVFIFFSLYWVRVWRGGERKGVRGRGKESGKVKAVHVQRLPSRWHSHTAGLHLFTAFSDTRTHPLTHTIYKILC